jgi:hypothetical protein
MKLVLLAFGSLDKDKSGVVDIEDIRGVYNGKFHPDVIRGTRSEDEILSEFLMNFEGGGGQKDGRVTLKEFENYYANISASVDDDDYFELMVRNAWHISGGKGNYENTTNRRVLVTHDDGRQTVEEVKNDLGMKGDDKGEILRRLRTQGLSAVSINTNGATDGSNGRGGDGSSSSSYQNDDHRNTSMNRNADRSNINNPQIQPKGVYGPRIEQHQQQKSSSSYQQQDGNKPPIAPPPRIKPKSLNAYLTKTC